MECTYYKKVVKNDLTDDGGEPDTEVLAQKKGGRMNSIEWKVNGSDLLVQGMEENVNTICRLGIDIRMFYGTAGETLCVDFFYAQGLLQLGEWK
jgi:hypothetical protein